MRKQNLVSYGMIIISLMIAQWILVNQFTISTAFTPWGIVADDESVIQPFITSRSTKKDFRIPQDLQTLDIDSFYVYLEWRGSTTVREFIIQILEEKELEIIVGSETTIEIYWEIRDEITIQMSKGVNEWNDPRFALKLIDNNIMYGFQKADNTEKIRILYRNVEIEFFHKTSYAEIEQTKTVQQWNTEAIILAFWTIFLGFVSAFASRWILNKATYVPDLPHWSLWILIFLIIVISAVLFFMISGYNLDEILRVIVLIPAPIISVFFAVYFAFWLASVFRPKKLLEILFVVLDLPTLNEIRTGERKLRDEKDLPVDAIVMDGYINQDGIIELVNDPDSYWETVRRIKMGGIRFNIAKLGKRIKIKQKLKNFDDIIFVESFEKNDIEVKIKDNALYSVSSIILIIGAFTWIVPLFLSIASVITSIIGTLFLVSGALFFVWENVDISSPIVNVSPITDRDAITIIRDKLTLDMKNEEISDLEMHLYEEKATKIRRIRNQTLKAVELIEESVLPIAELAGEEELDLETLPEPIKKVFKTWIEDWKGNKGLVDMKQIAEDSLKDMKKGENNSEQTDK